MPEPSRKRRLPLAGDFDLAARVYRLRLTRRPVCPGPPPRPGRQVPDHRTDTSVIAAREKGMMGKRPGIDLNTAQILASMGAAVTGAILTSYLGNGGTMVGTAVGAGVSTAGFAIYKHYLVRTKEKVAPVIVQHARHWGPVAGAHPSGKRTAPGAKGAQDTPARTVASPNRVGGSGAGTYGAYRGGRAAGASADQTRAPERLGPRRVPGRRPHRPRRAGGHRGRLPVRHGADGQHREQQHRERGPRRPQRSPGVPETPAGSSAGLACPTDPARMANSMTGLAGLAGPAAACGVVRAGSSWCRVRRPCSWSRLSPLR